MSVWIYTVMCLSWLTTCPPWGVHSPTLLYETKQKCIEAGLKELKYQGRDYGYVVKCDEVYRASANRPVPGEIERG